ncbi:MAG: tetratricopeptide repeat protein [Planctomycetota bacterium]
MKSLTLAVAVTIFLVVLAPAALAQDGVQWVPSVKEALKQAKERGALIFVGMTLADEASNDAQIEAYKDPAFVKASKNFVCIFANPTIRATVTVEIDGKKVKRCAAAPTITCEQSQICYREIRQNHTRNTDSTNAVRMPYNMFIDGKNEFIAEVVNGTVEGGFDVVPGPALAAVMNELVAKLGKPLTTAQYEKLKKILADADAAKKKGDLKKASKLYGEVIEANKLSALADQAQKNLDEIDSVAKGELEEALAKVDEDPLAAMIALEAVIENYAGTETAREARKKLSELKKRKDVKKLLGKLKKEKEATAKIADAEELVEAGEYTRAIAALKSIARKYRGTKAAETATARVAELEGDPEIAKKIEAAEAEKFSERCLRMGRNYATNGMTDKAKAEFRKVIDKYPGTPWAEEAKKEIEKLK